MATSKAAQQMCCVRINYHALLLPSDKGRKLVELLEGALLVKQSYDDGPYFELTGETPDVEYQTVKPGQVRHATRKAPAAADVLQLGKEPLKLTGGGR